VHERSVDSHSGACSSRTRASNVKTAAVPGASEARCHTTLPFAPIAGSLNAAGEALPA
jgi:hypothetical protein